MSRPGRHAPIARSESIDEDSDDVPPPPSYDEVVRRDLVSSIQEPPAGASANEVDSLVDVLLSRVKEQRDDLNAELGRGSESEENEETFATARSDVAEKEALNQVELEKTKPLSPKKVQESKAGEERVTVSEDSEDDAGEDSRMLSSSDSFSNSDSFCTDEGDEEERKRLREDFHKHASKGPAHQRDERFFSSLSKLQERRQSDKFHRDVSRQRQEERKDKDEDLELIEMLPVTIVLREPDEDNVSLPDLREMQPLSSDVESDSQYSPQVSRQPSRRVSTVEDEPDADADAEAGRRRRRYSNRESDWDCGSTPIPFLRELVNFIVHRIVYTRRHWPHWSTQKRLILVLSVLFVIGLVLLVSLLPASFVYVDYDKMGFVYNRVTAKIDYDRVYDYGCYLLAPQHSMILLPATAHFLDLQPSVYDSGGLTIGLEVHLQYFLRPSELFHLYRKYNDDYVNIIHRFAESAIKNTAPKFSLDEFRLNRSMVEGELLNELRYVLSGDCCEHSKNSRFPSFGDGKKCNSSKNCHQGKHVDVGFFQFGALKIPQKVLKLYMKQVVLEMETERERYFQEKAVQVALNRLSVQKIHNEAQEIKKKAEAQSHIILTTARASKLQVLEQTYQVSLKKIYSLLNISKEEDRTSLMYLQTLKQMKDNLVAFSYNYDKETLFTP